MIKVTDDVGTECFEGGTAEEAAFGYSRRARASVPAPPPAVRVLRVTSDYTTIKLPLRAQAHSSR